MWLLRLVSEASLASSDLYILLGLMSFCCVAAAVPKSSHYGFFGILKHKLGLSGGRHKKQVKEELASPGEVRVLESPQVVRIRCEEGVEAIGDIPGSPVVIRRKVGVNP